MSAQFWLFAGVGIVLQLLLLHILVSRSLYRTYPAVFVFILVLFLTGVIDIAPLVEIGRANVALYWINDLARQMFFALAVISLIYQALADHPQRERWRFALLGLSFGVCTLSLLAHHRVPISYWLTPVARDLSFFALMMNMLLWISLMRSTKANRLMLLLSCGVGLQMAGEAIGQSLRALGHTYSSRGCVSTGNTVLVAAHLLCLFTWWRAFVRHAPPGRTAPNRAVSAL